MRWMASAPGTRVPRRPPGPVAAREATHGRGYHRRARHRQARPAGPGADAQGRKVLQRKLRREEVRAFFAALPPCLVGMEACATADAAAICEAVTRPNVRT